MTSATKRVALALGLVLLVPRAARAEVPVAPPPPEDSAESMPPASPPPAPERRWYGWQILASDAAASLTWLAAAKSGLQPLYALGAVIYVAGGPALNSQNGRGDRVIPSLVARVVAPVVGVVGIIVVETSICAPVNDGGYFYSSCQREGAVAALLAPMLVASIVDIAFAWAPAPDAPPAKGFAWALVPTSMGAGATLGFAGRF